MPPHSHVSTDGMRLRLQLAPIPIYGLMEAGFRDFSFLTASYIAMECDSVHASCAMLRLAITAVSFSLWGENQRCGIVIEQLILSGFTAVSLVSPGHIEQCICHSCIIPAVDRQ